MQQDWVEMVRQARCAASFVVTDQLVAGMPEPVRDHLRSVGVAGEKVIRTVRLKQKGSLRMREGKKWLPFKAEQCFTINPPGFLWNDRVRSIPYLNISVTDMFAHGRGRLRAKLLSLIKLADVQGPEVNQGELLRYLAESVWFPTAWLAEYLQWERIDSRSAKARLAYGELSVAANFHFSENGRVDEVTAERYREEHGRFALREWSGRLWDYCESHGIHIPTKVEVTWRLDTGDFTCFQAEITSIEYDL